MKYFKNVNYIHVSDWDGLIKETYGKPYSFQQQDGCQSAGIFAFTVPIEETHDNEMHDNIPIVLNGEKMGVKFKTWLDANPEQPFFDNTQWWKNELFWERNFYPDIYTLIDDLHKKGLIDKGEYIMDISW